MGVTTNIKELSGEVSLLYGDTVSYEKKDNEFGILDEHGLNFYWNLTMMLCKKMILMREKL